MTLIRNNGGRSTINLEARPREMTTTPSTRTPSLGSPCSVTNPSMNSVGSFQQSSPESTPHGSPALVFQPSPNYSGLLESPVGSSVGQTTYEDHIASQILNQFPEIGRILDNQ